MWTNKKGKRFSKGKRGIARTMAAIIIAVVIVVAAIGGGVYYISSRTGSSGAIKVGVSMPFTGFGANLGYWTNTGMKMAEDEINAKGGVLGRNVTIIPADDQGTVDGEVSAMNKLIYMDEVKLILGGPYTTLALAGMDIAAKTDVLYIMVYASGTDVGNKYLSNPSKYWMCIANWSNSTSYALAEVDWLKYAITNSLFSNKTSTYAQIVEDSDAGRNIAATRDKLLQAQGWTSLDTEFVPTSTVDFYSVLTKIKGLNPAVLLSYGATTSTWANEQAQFVQDKLSCLHIQWWVPSQPGYFGTTGTAANGVVYSQAAVWVPGFSAATAAFITKFKSLFPTAPAFDQNPGIQYDTLYRLEDAIGKAGTADDIHAIANVLATTAYTGVVGTYMAGADHASIAGTNYLSSSVWQVQNMTYQEIWPTVSDSVTYQAQPWLSP